MKKIFIILLLFVPFFSIAQTEKEKLATVIKEFHQALVQKNTTSVKEHTDEALSYGHSNGWIETKTDFIKNLETGFMKYRDYKEDSLTITMNGEMANARFVADISATLNGNDGNFHLKVLEVWVRKNNQWVLFARQAVR